MRVIRRPTLPAPTPSSVHRCTAFVLAALLLLTGGSTVARASDAPAAILPLEDFSPGFLGMYRKVMLIEAEIRKHSEQYGVDFDLARAVCLYESGGNAGLTSVAGAQGYFQVMPPTYRELRVTSNIEAGVKYLGQMIRQFDREDRAVAAYNGGPGRVGRAGGLPLETLQYVLGVGHYRTVLKLYEPSIRHHASTLHVAAVQAGDDWSALSRRLGVPDWELRMHNPFLAERRLRPGQLIAYPPAPRGDLFREVEGTAEYRMRHGDNYIKLAFTLGVEPETLRSANGLWQIQSVPAGALVRIPLAADRSQVLHAALGRTPAAPAIAAAVARATPEPTAERAALAITTAPPESAPTSAPAPRRITHRVTRGDTLGGLASRYGTTVSAIQRANGMGSRTLVRLGETLRIPEATTAGVTLAAAQRPSAPRRVTHRVTRGDTLGGLAERYGTTVRAIQQANGMGRRTAIRIGETLQVPAARGQSTEE